MTGPTIEACEGVDNLAGLEFIQMVKPANSRRSHCHGEGKAKWETRALINFVAPCRAAIRRRGWECLPNGGGLRDMPNSAFHAEEGGLLPVATRHCLLNVA
ncbi:hypothetical protein FALCPG4_004551 [Fusarium falciforme]